MEHLRLEIFDLEGTGSKFAWLPEDASITITDTSEVFASGDVWSHSFTLNVRANAHIFGTAGDMHGSRLHEQINKRRARLWVEEVALYYGYLKLDDEVEVDAKGNVDVGFESGQKTFDEMIEGAKANQVPMMSDVRIGVALWRKRWACTNLKLTASAVFSDGSTSYPSVVTHTVHAVEIGDEDPELTPFSFDGEEDGNSVQQYPRMVFPKGKFDNWKTGVNDEEINCLNTDTPYDDAHPYCNIALCYQKSGYLKKNQDGSTYNDYASEPEAQRGYDVMPANRVNSAPNFFVIYWLKSLMKHLGIHIVENQMMDVEDLRRLFFVNTKCAYKEPNYLRNPNKYDGSLGKYQFGSGGDLVPEYFGEKDGKRFNGPQKITKPEDCGFTSYGITVGTPSYDHYDVAPEDVTAIDRKIESLQIDRIIVKVKEVAGMSDSVRAYYDGYNGNKQLARNRYLHDAIATSECFPNADISEVIKAIESGFGVRFLFSDDYQRVRIVLLRNIFRSDDVQNIECEIISEGKLENCIRGFRMTYGDSEDTTFYYKGFADKLPHKKEIWVDDSDKHDYSHWNLNADYGSLIHKVSAFDKTCYVDPKTGDAFGIKVDKDAKRYDELHPSLFEYAGYMDAEDGNCTGEEETIETIQVGFAPAIMNDVNFEKQRDGESEEQRYALFVDASMRPRRPDLEDLPKEGQPNIKSYDDSDARYSVDDLYAKHGPSSESKMTSEDGIVKPGEFAIASDMFARRNGLNINLMSKVYLERDGYDGEGGHDYKYYDTFDIYWPVSFNIDGHINEGYRLYLQDNFEPNDDGVTPIETKDWGLTLGIMRGSGGDAYVDYTADPDDGEGNDTWEVMPGSNVSAHPDTCDNYGNEWDYNGTIHVDSAAEAESEIRSRYPDTANTILDPRWPVTVQELANAGWEVSGDLTRQAKYYYYKLVINSPSEGYVNVYATPIAASSTRSYMGPSVYTREELKEYILNLWNQYQFDLVNHDNLRLIYAVNPPNWSDLAYLRAVYYGYATERDLDNGLGVTDGRFSLKLRAEKLNPYFDTKQPESPTNRRYLEISNPNLRGRGLIDQFYKEYSFWIRNARIANRTVRMELAQLLAIDKTKKVTIGDITGYIRKMQYSVNNKTGLGNVTMEIMYI